MAPKFVFPGKRKEKIGKKIPPDLLLLDNLETSLAITMNGSILERFIKPRASTMFGYPLYFLDGPGPSIAISVPYKYFLTVIFIYG